MKKIKIKLKLNQLDHFVQLITNEFISQTEKPDNLLDMLVFSLIQKFYIKLQELQIKRQASYNMALEPHLAIALHFMFGNRKMDATQYEITYLLPLLQEVNKQYA